METTVPTVEPVDLYYQRTKEDLEQADLLPPSFTVRSNNSAPLVTSFLRNWYEGKHLWFSNKIFAPEGSKQRALEARKLIDLTGDTRYERRTVCIDDLSVDVLFMTKPSIVNKRWTVISLGIRVLYEEVVAKDSEEGPSAGPLQKAMVAVNSNFALYNYPGMGANDKNPLSREATIKAHNALLEFLYAEKKPRQVVDYGQSFGGFVISEGRERRPSREGVRTITVLDRTDLQACNILWNDGVITWALNKSLGWNMSVDLSKEDAPVIGIMNIETNSPVRIYPGDRFTYTDKAVSQATSIANILLNTTKDPVVIGIPGGHNDICPDFSVLGECIEEVFARL